MTRLLCLLLVGWTLMGCAADDHEGHDDHDDHEGHGDEPKPAKVAEDHAEEGVVRLSPAALARAGVRVTAVTTGSLADSVTVPAEVQLNPDRVAHVSPLVDGVLLEVRAKVGDTVEADQPLAQLRSFSLGQARAELTRTNAMRDVALKTLRRQKKLRSDKINSERSLLEAQGVYDQAVAEREAAKSRLQVFGAAPGSGPDMTFVSPIAGRVVERHATRGEGVSPADTLFVVADMTRVWVIGRVYEQQVARVDVGMKATLTLNAYPSRTWTGHVDFIGAMVDEKTRTLPIRVEFDNPDGRLRPGLYGALRLEAGAQASADAGTTVMVPVTAVQTVDNQPVVFVPGDHPGEFERRAVTLGRESDGQIEVLHGLAPNAQVVVEGGFVLKSELMRGELGHGHAH